MRQHIVATLKTKFPEQHAKAYEEAIAKACNTHNIDYKDFAYEKTGELMVEEDKVKRKKIATDIVNGVKEWQSSVYKELRDKQLIENDQELNPPTVEEGAYKCRKCKSERTYSFSIQTRSADEPATVFVKCAECGMKWRD